VARKDLGDARVERLHRLDHHAELRGVGLDRQAERVDDRGVARERVPMRNGIGSRYSPFLPCVRLLRCKEVEDENDNYKDENDWGSGGRN